MHRAFQRVKVEQMRQLLNREENILSDMLEQVIRYRVERRRKEQEEKDKDLPEEIEKELMGIPLERKNEEEKKWKRLNGKTTKRKVNENYFKKGPPKSYAALIKEVSNI